MDSLRFSSGILYTSNFTPASLSVESSTIGFYDFQETSNIGLDLTGNGYDIYWENVPQLTSGR